MAILIDPPRWPAHGTFFGHLVSDSSLDELLDFAQRAGLPPLAFDHDHVDVPQSAYPDLIAAGAREVTERDLITSLIASGLRVRTPHRTPTRTAARRELVAAWAGLGLPGTIRDDLLARWSEPHRHYHDVRHLAQCLGALASLGAATRATRLGAWFHDAVYEALSSDEERSAQLAEDILGPLLPASEVAAVSSLIRMTAGHRPEDGQGRLLSDADLSVLGQIPGRYRVYLRDARLEYGHLSEEQWRAGRSEVVLGFLTSEHIYSTEPGRRLWEGTARANLTAELGRLQTVSHRQKI